MLNWDGLHAARFELRKAWQRARPFPHLVIKNLFQPDALAELQATFPEPNALWADRRHLHSKKHTVNDLTLMPAGHIEAIAELNGAAFLGYLESLTGMTGLEADPHLYGGGLHVTQRGGFLDIHVDFQQSNLMPGRTRALNLLVYLTKDYQPEWGGGLQLCEMDEPGHRFPRILRTIYPVANRAVLFATSTDSWHGHTDKWASETNRISMAMYYYRAGTEGKLRTTDYRPLEGQMYKRIRKTAGRVLRRVGLR